MDRAFSLLKIKAVDEEKRILTGVATTIRPDRMGDIVESKGAEFQLPIPFLWQHDSHQPIGWVTKAKVNKEDIEVEIKLATMDEPGALRDRLEEAWQSIKTGLVGGLSIGFSAIESARIEGTYTYRYLKWLWLELSAVTIPANGEATITQIKQIDNTQRAALGLTRRDGVRLGVSPGVSGKSQIPKPGEPEMKTIPEQIAALESARTAKVEKMTAVMTKSAEEGRSSDAQESEEFDTLEAEVTQIDTDLKRLKSLEKMNVARATPVAGVTTVDGGSAIRGNGSVIVVTEKLEKGIEFARYAMCLLASKGNAPQALNLAKLHYPNSPRVVKALELQSSGQSLERLMKANVEAGTTLDTTWAAPLVDYQNFAGDFVEFLRPRTIIGQFGVGSVPSLNRIPFNVRIAGQTSGGSASWVGEGAPKPLTSFDFTATELRWFKIAAIAVLTQELIRFSDPSAERLVRDGLADAVIERMDLDFMDPTKALSANVSPASITNGIAAIPATGTDADGIRADLMNLWAPFIAARNPPRSAVYVMDSTTALALSLMVNALGGREFPGISMNGGTFNEIPVVVSDYLPRDSSGGMVALVNARDVWLADDGQVTVDASDQASLQMLDNPTNNSATATATSMVSMWQTNSVAFRAERFVNWARRRTSGVAYLTGVSWGE